MNTKIIYHANINIHTSYINQSSKNKQFTTQYNRKTLITTILFLIKNNKWIIFLLNIKLLIYNNSLYHQAVKVTYCTTAARTGRCAADQRADVKAQRTPNRCRARAAVNCDGRLNGDFTRRPLGDCFPYWL